MIGLALSLLTSRVAGPVASVVAVVALGLAVGQCSGRVKAEQGRADAERQAQMWNREFKQCTANRVALEASIRAQNDAVEALKREGQARVAESRKAVLAARAVAESHRRKADGILAERVGADKCAEADRLMLEFGS